ncbi:hypothetical protein LJC60_07170, partial [Ruminococcaceae bacterium OttesenSCG-928-D13]|nr:hypothetical protein [Ruminococcaceae bacterium OttesenSCG-928-D13]
TFPSVAQALKCPMWLVPETYRNYKMCNPELLETLLVEEPSRGHTGKYEETKNQYLNFAVEFIARAEAL